MVRNMVVTTARATTKAAREMGAGSTSRTTTTTATAVTAATMTPNGDKDNENGICRRQERRDIIRRSKSASKRNRQLIS